MTSTIAEELLVKSRQRVKAHGEVFTPRRMVNQMLDLVSEDLESGPGFVDKTFLEPAAGNGNFLVAILDRKLQAITKHHPRPVWSQESLFALASIYGIELLEDNHQDAKATMLEEFVRFLASCGVACDEESDLMRAARFVIDTNIVLGNTLTGLDWRGEEIRFSWWNRVVDAPGQVQREDFTLSALRGDHHFDFNVYETYAVCPIDQVHREARAGV